MVIRSDSALQSATADQPIRHAEVQLGDAAETIKIHLAEGPGNTLLEMFVSACERLVRSSRELRKLDAQIVELDQSISLSTANAFESNDDSEFLKWLRFASMPMNQKASLREYWNDLATDNRDAVSWIDGNAISVADQLRQVSFDRAAFSDIRNSLLVFGTSLTAASAFTDKLSKLDSRVVNRKNSSILVPPDKRPKSANLRASHLQQRRAVIAKVEDTAKYTFLTTPEAALYFEVKPRTIYRWRDKGELRDGARRGPSPLHR